MHLLLKPCYMLEYTVGVSTGRRNPLIPPRWLHHIGLGDYSAIGDEFFAYFCKLCALRPDERVLDIGCGTGRMALPLTAYLRDGTYDGLDIVAESVGWCERVYTPRHPNFRFHFADMRNDLYNPRGKYRARDYRFPFEAASFDFVFLTSVFTHMVAGDMENYLSEIGRVLRPGGRTLISYFLLNPDSERLIREGRSAHTFRGEKDGYRTDRPDRPEVAVAYAESRVRDLYTRHGFEIREPVHYGTWCGRADGMSWQDIMIASKTRA